MAAKTVGAQRTPAFEVLPFESHTTRLIPSITMTRSLPTPLFDIRWAEYDTAVRSIKSITFHQKLNFLQWLVHFQEIILNRNIVVQKMYRLTIHKQLTAYWIISSYWIYGLANVQ